MLDLLVLKILYIILIGSSSVALNRFADHEVTRSAPWWAGNVLSVLCGIMAINELAHLIALVRGVQP